jgi:hypothetical protein
MAALQADATQGGSDGAMDKPFRVLVFGKAGCDKCKMLNRRLDRLFADGQWQDFEKQYCDVETEDGLIAFCRAQCVNPSRIPALLVTRRLPDGTYAPMPHPTATTTTAATACGRSQLYQYVGLQTDYSDVGNGLITPEMIEAVLQEAKAS